MNSPPPSKSLPADPAEAEVIYRHPLPVRLFHWTNALCVLTLLMSGLQIFNAYPRLQWALSGDWDTPAFFEITGNKDVSNPQSWIAVNGRKVIDTGGHFGAPVDVPPVGPMNIAFPKWLVLGQDGDLARGRGWHFLALYFFAFNFLAYLCYGVISRRFWRTLRPTSQQLRPSAIARDLWMHLRLRQAQGSESATYNLLQKVAYASVLFIFFPLMIATGMTMSPSLITRAPWLFDFFGGHQCARTLHFFGTTLIVLFVLVHVFQVFVAGFANHMRSILSGWFQIHRGTHEKQ